MEQKRISQLTALDDSAVDALINNSSAAAEWAMALDCKKEDINNTNAGQLDNGTVYIPVSRVGLLTQSGLVPQSMLPTSISDVIDGTMGTPGSGGKQVFTGPNNTKYVNKNPVAGEVQADIDTIYRDVKLDGVSDTKPIYTQYRFVAGENPQFVPIPSDLVLVDGDATEINDDVQNNYTRAVDIRLGTPSPDSGSNVLFVNASNQLVHSTTSVTAGSYPSGQTTDQTPGFGGTFKVPYITVNETGHITAASAPTVTIPKTPARTGTAGLIKIGTNIQPIVASGQAGPGTVNPSQAVDYVEVAAADHKHKAGGKLTLTNTNDGNKEYDGSSDVGYNFNKFLQVPLPSNAPYEGQFLVAKTVGNVLSAIWDYPAVIITPQYAFLTAAGNTGSTPLTLTLGTHSSDMGVSSNAVTGLFNGKLYVITYSIPMTISTPGTTLDTATFSVTDGTTTVSMAHVIDESISGTNSAIGYTGIPNYVNGVIYFVAGSAGTCQFKLGVTHSGVSWSVSGGSVQIAEVK